MKSNQPSLYYGDIDQNSQSGQKNIEAFSENSFSNCKSQFDSNQEMFSDHRWNPNSYNFSEDLSHSRNVFGDINPSRSSPTPMNPTSANKTKPVHFHHTANSSHLSASGDSVSRHNGTSSSAPVLTTASSPAVFPRSLSEACFDSASSKFRQLPCRTFISVGTCPYRERCVYLHDPRCICKEAKTKTRRKNKEDVVLDSLFWPVMPQSLVNEKLDGNGQPHVIQTYSVPAPQNDQYQAHDRAVYSMWMHFVDFCLANQSPKAAPGAVSPCFSAPNTLLNRYTNRRRLPVFFKLASTPEKLVAPSSPMMTSNSFQSNWETPLHSLPRPAIYSQMAADSYGHTDDEDEGLYSQEAPFSFVQRNLFPEEGQTAAPLSDPYGRGNASPVTVTASFLHSPSQTSADLDLPMKQFMNKFPTFPEDRDDEYPYWPPLPMALDPSVHTVGDKNLSWSAFSQFAEEDHRSRFANGTKLFA